MAKLIHKILKPKGKWRLGMIHALNQVFPCHALNVGGGPAFCYLGWLNLEEVTSRANPHSFKLTPDCRFPAADESVGLVYTSHCLEHLDDATVAQVLKETVRVLKRDGDFIIKIPDFDRVLDRWRRRESAFFSDEIWGLGSIKHTWPRRGLADSIHYRVAMIFCGYWNAVYGEHFGQAHADHPEAYHGPPAIPQQELEALLEQGTPHHIAGVLRKRVLATEASFHFNHQNAWSREELSALLTCYPFKSVMFDAGQILERFRDVPTLEVMKPISLYCLAQKAA